MYTSMFSSSIDHKDSMTRRNEPGTKQKRTYVSTRRDNESKETEWAKGRD